MKTKKDGRTMFQVFRQLPMAALRDKAKDYNGIVVSVKQND
jgi:hypothetical protein